RWVRAIGKGLEEQYRPGSDGQCSRNVELGIFDPATRLRKILLTEKNSDQPDRRVDEHHRAPAEADREKPSRHSPRCKTTREYSSNNPERPISRLTLRIESNENSKCRDRRHRCPNTLDSPRSEERRVGKAER